MQMLSANNIERDLCWLGRQKRGSQSRPGLT